MKDMLSADLERAKQLAFARYAGCGELIRRFHALAEKAKEHPDYGLLKKMYEWAFVPLSLWPVDAGGMALRVLNEIERGNELDPAMRLVCRRVQKAPPAETCRMVGKYEHAIKAGSYEIFIEAQHKFDSIERELGKNAELRADWEEIKRLFDVKKYRNAIEVIRRRPVQERNFHSADWKLSWTTEKERFQNVFDAFCHAWDLYGMEGDKPLLLKLTVTITAYGTFMMIPKYWSFDPRRDVKWNEIMRHHRLRSAQRQGQKLSANQAEREEEAERATELWEEATKAKLKGDARMQWVQGRLGWPPETDESKLKRLLKGKDPVHLSASNYRANRKRKPVGLISDNIRTDPSTR